MQDIFPDAASNTREDIEDFLSFCETVARKAKKKGLNEAKLRKLLDEKPDCREPQAARMVCLGASLLVRIHYFLQQAHKKATLALKTLHIKNDIEFRYPIMSRGKKISLILAVIFAVLGGGALLIHRTVTETQSELNAVAEPMIREMSASGWSKGAIDKYSSPELKKWLADNKMANGMPGMNVFGKVKQYKGITQFSASSNNAAIVAEVQFDTGDAYISLELSKHEGRWLINSFNINSPVLLQNAGGKQNAK